MSGTPKPNSVPKSEELGPKEPLSVPNQPNSVPVSADSVRGSTDYERLAAGIMRIAVRRLVDARSELVGLLEPGRLVADGEGALDIDGSTGVPVILYGVEDVLTMATDDIVNELDKLIPEQECGGCEDDDDGQAHGGLALDDGYGDGSDADSTTIFDDDCTSTPITAEPHTTINWKHLLVRFAPSRTSRRPSMNRPPRRFPELVGVVPGTVIQPDKPVVMAVIDTSPSMDHESLALVSAELDALARCADITVVECDQQVRRSYRYSEPIREVHGRNGTDFRPPLKKEFLMQIRPDIVVFFCDGEGPAPASPPCVAVVWCLTPGGEQPSEWGHAVWMHEPAGGSAR